MTEESHAAMMRALDAVRLDADMRAMAENAMHHFASVTAEPSAAQVVDEIQAESGANGSGAGGGMDLPTGMTVAPMVPEPYHPVSPFRLKFTFGSDGSYSGVTMEDPTFCWSEPDEDGNPSTSLKTAGIGTIGLNGTVYLNVTLSGEDGAKKFASAQVSMSSSGDISVPLYQLHPTKGVVKDYRHAMISLGIGGSNPDDVSVDMRDSDDATNDGKLQIKDWDHETPPEAETTIVQDLVSTQDAVASDKMVARQSDKALKYKASGQFKAASDTNIVFTEEKTGDPPTSTGNVTIGVYYI